MFFKNRGGRLKKIYVQVGDEVEKDEIIAELDSGDLKNQLKAQKIQLKKAELRRDQIRANKGDKYEKAMSEYDVELAKLACQSMEEELEECELRANMAGHVSYVDYNLREGDYVNAFQSLVRIADPKNLQLQLSGSLISNFRLGMEAQIIVDKRNYQGTVVMTPGDVPQDTPENLKEIVRIDLSDPPSDLKMGGNGQVNLVLDRREDTIVVPRNLVRNYMGRKYVLILEDGLKKERDVEIGLETSTEVEVVKGLEEGEVIILR